jgi:hypothetical protein
MKVRIKRIASQVYLTKEEECFMVDGYKTTGNSQLAENGTRFKVRGEYTSYQIIKYHVPLIQNLKNSITEFTFSVRL